MRRLSCRSGLRVAHCVAVFHTCQLMSGCASDRDLPLATIVDFADGHCERHYGRMPELRKPDGRWRIMDCDGERLVEGQYRSGVPEGLWRRWYKSGGLRYEGRYAGGKRDGAWTVWYPNGHVAAQLEYKLGSEVAGSFFNAEGAGVARIEFCSTPMVIVCDYDESRQPPLL
jgi:MORN repeat protein